jgi:4-hydroxy-2-oxoheptanedioate aldolase
MGVPRSLNFGDTPDDFVINENIRTKCFVMIETPGALENVNEIAALPAVDGLFMGPYDLSLTRGRGQYKATQADHSDAKTIALAANSANKLLGLPVSSDDDFAFAMTHRPHVVTIADDLSVLVDGLKAKLGASSKKLADSRRLGE